MTTNQKRLIIATPILLAILFFIYSLQQAMTEQKIKAWKQLCSNSTYEEVFQSVQFVYKLAGVPEDRIATAIHEATDATCDCIVKISGETNISAIESFVANPKNKDVLNQCSEQKQAEILENYKE